MKATTWGKWSIHANISGQWKQFYSAPTLVGAGQAVEETTRRGLDARLCYGDDHIDVRMGRRRAGEIRSAHEAIPVPACAAFMGCLCAGHARGDDASAACNTSELAL